MIWQVRDEREQELWQETRRAGKALAAGLSGLVVGTFMMGAGTAIKDSGAVGLVGGALLHAFGLAAAAIGGAAAVGYFLKSVDRCGKAVQRHLNITYY